MFYNNCANADMHEVKDMQLPLLLEKQQGLEFGGVAMYTDLLCVAI